MSGELLKRYQRDKRALSNAPSQIARAEQFLSTHFQIRLNASGSDIFEEVRSNCGLAVGRLFEDLNKRRAMGTPAEEREAEGAFYDLVSHQPLLGLVHSRKWPFILDAALYLSALVDHCKLTGPFLDFACHAGYHALWVAQEHGLSGLGVDRSGRAVESGRRSSVNQGVEDLVQFQVASRLDLGSGDRFGLIYTVDGPAQPDLSWLSRFSRHLRDDGLLVLIGSWPHLSGRSLKRDLGRAGLDLLMADVLGGWDGEEFGANMVLVFAAGSGAQPWPNVNEEAQSIWDSGFAPYCNAAGRSPAEKILSKFRAFNPE